MRTLAGGSGRAPGEVVHQARQRCHRAVLHDRVAVVVVLVQRIANEAGDVGPGARHEVVRHRQLDAAGFRDAADETVVSNADEGRDVLARYGQRAGLAADFFASARPAVLFGLPGRQSRHSALGRGQKSGPIFF